MVYPNSRDGAIAVEIDTGEVITNGMPGLDIFGAYYVAELPNGEVGLYERGKGLISSVSLKAH